MANITIPASIGIVTPPNNVRPVLLSGTVGLFVPAYLDDPSVQSYKPADADVSDAVAAVQGISILAGVATGYGILVSDGVYDLGSAILTQGQTYYLSHTVGRICLFSDLVTGDRVIEVGIAQTTQFFKVQLLNTGITIP